MIFDDFKNLKKYGIDPDITDFILNLDKDIKEGRHEIKKGAYINIERYQTRKKETLKLEAHKKHIDIQFLIEGKEKVYTTGLEGLVEEVEYSKEKDVVFYKTPNRPLNKSYLIENKFMILYPNDAHAPCIDFYDKSQNVKKGIVKIEIE